MERFTNHDLMAAYCKATEQWGLVMQFRYGEQEDFSKPFVTGNYFNDLNLAAPDLADDDGIQMVADGEAFFFGTQEEIEAIYNRTKGDDSNEINTYDGPVHVYCLTCDKRGYFMNENT